MNMPAPEWLAAFVLAVFTHVALAVGFGGEQGALIERGPGDGGPIIIGSLTDSISGELEAEEAAEVEEAADAEEVNESGDIQETEEISKAEEVPETAAVSEAVEAPKTYDTSQVKLVQEIEDTPPVEDVKEADLKPDEAVEPEPVEAVEPVHDAVLPPLPKETVDVIPQKSQPAVARILKKKPPPKKQAANKKKKKKKRLVRGGRIDSRRGGTGGRGRAGGGGKGLGGRALRSNYQGRVIAHLRRYKSYPKAAKRRGIRGAVRMKFTINSAGRVVNSRLVASSGSPVLDGGARATIRRANPFPPFPKGLGKRRMTFIVPIRFSVR